MVRFAQPQSTSPFLPFFLFVDNSTATCFAYTTVVLGQPADLSKEASFVRVRWLAQAQLSVRGLREVNWARLLRRTYSRHVQRFLSVFAFSFFVALFLAPVRDYLVTLSFGLPETRDNGFWAYSLVASLLTRSSPTILCSCVFVALSTVFHSTNSPNNSPFSHSVLRSYSALLVLSTTYLFMKDSLSRDITLCGWLGLKHQLTYKSHQE